MNMHNSTPILTFRRQEPNSNSLRFLPAPEILPQVSCPRTNVSLPATIAAVFDMEKLLNP